MMRCFSLLLAVLLSFGLSGPVAAAQTQPVCGTGTITVSGIVHGLATVKQEPAAVPQSSFTLQKPSCGTADVLVSVPAPIFCSEGDRANVTGEYLRPTALIPVPVISRAHVECLPDK